MDKATGVKGTAGNHIRRFFGALLAVTALALLACGSAATAPPSATATPTDAGGSESATGTPVPETGPAQAPQARGALLRVGAVADSYRNDPRDPSRAGLGMFPVNTNIFDQLILVDPDYQLQPMLAESWEYLAETSTWRFHLRRGVRFHDGQPFNAAAVVAMVEQWWSGEYSGPRLRINERSAVAVDEYTVDITPTTPHLRFPEEISHTSFGVRAPGSDPFSGGHVGTGPFSFVDYVRDDRLSVERNPDYWGAGPNVDRIEFRFIPDPNTRVLVLQAQEVDVIYDVPPEATALLQGMRDIQVVNTDVSAAQVIMVLLTGEPPRDLTQDILVREAIGYAIDRQQVIDLSFFGFAAPGQTFGPAHVLGEYAGRIVGYEYDPARARTLLENAGWAATGRDGIREKDGRRLTLELINGFPAGPENGQTAEILQGQLGEVGIDLRIINIPDNATYSARLENKEGDLFLELGNQNSPSPCFLAGIFYGRYPQPGAYARAFAPGPLGWPSYDDAIDACNSAPTIEEAAMHRANAIHVAVDEARVLIPLVGITRIWAAGANVQDFAPHPVRLHVRWEPVSVMR